MALAVGVLVGEHAIIRVRPADADGARAGRGRIVGDAEGERLRAASSFAR
jgi:hypothetical protein